MPAKQGENAPKRTGLTRTGERRLEHESASRRQTDAPGANSETAAELEAICDAVVPEAIEALQQLVHFGELAGADAADLFDRADVALVEVSNRFCDFWPFQSG